jgi:hypothetical protein
MRSCISLSVLIGFALLSAGQAHAQASASLGVGLASPQGDLGDYFDSGYTVRAQLALSALGIVEVHTQAGWSRFPVGDATVDREEYQVGDADLLHAGVGARLGIFGLIFVGANGAYFFGEGDNEIGFFPEVGIGIGPLEVVADYRFGSDFDWFGLRGGLKF